MKLQFYPKVYEMNDVLTVDHRSSIYDPEWMQPGVPLIVEDVQHNEHTADALKFLGHDGYFKDGSKFRPVVTLSFEESKAVEILIGRLTGSDVPALSTDHFSDLVALETRIAVSTRNS